MNKERGLEAGLWGSGISGPALAEMALSEPCHPSLTLPLAGAPDGCHWAAVSERPCWKTSGCCASPAWPGGAGKAHPRVWPPHPILQWKPWGRPRSTDEGAGTQHCQGTHLRPQSMGRPGGGHLCARTRPASGRLSVQGEMQGADGSLSLF